MKTLMWTNKTYFLGHFEPKMHPDFVQIDSMYCYRELYMIEEAYQAFVEMAKAALADSVHLKIISATRNFDYQKSLWENKWTGKTLVEQQKLTTTHKNFFHRALKIMEYTAPPGFTRHHWGTDIDINAVEDEYFQSEEGNIVFDWLQKNAGRFGFCQTYTAQDHLRSKGYKEEKWHWSYAKIADQIWREQIAQFELNDIKDFKGAESVKKTNFLHDFILSINTCH